MPPADATPTVFYNPDLEELDLHIPETNNRMHTQLHMLTHIRCLNKRLIIVTYATFSLLVVVAMFTFAFYTRDIIMEMDNSNCTRDLVDYPVCSFFEPYANGTGINKYNFEHAEPWTLHGWWPHDHGSMIHPYIKSGFQLCMKFKSFKTQFMSTKLARYMIDGLHNSTCCIFQYHEYMKHGCLMGYTYDQWYDNNMECIINRLDNTFKLKLSTASYCSNDKCNVPLQLTNSSDIFCTGCKPGMPICVDQTCHS